MPLAVHDFNLLCLSFPTYQPPLSSPPAHHWTLKLSAWILLSFHFLYFPFPFPPLPMFRRSILHSPFTETDPVPTTTLAALSTDSSSLSSDSESSSDSISALVWYYVCHFCMRDTGAYAGWCLSTNAIHLVSSMQGSGYICAGPVLCVTQLYFASALCPNSYHSKVLVGRVLHLGRFSPLGTISDCMNCSSWNPKAVPSHRNVHIPACSPHCPSCLCAHGPDLVRLPCLGSQSLESPNRIL